MKGKTLALICAAALLAILTGCAPKIRSGAEQYDKSLFRIFTKEKKGSKIREKEKR